jgi:hypothetical protein
VSLTDEFRSDFPTYIEGLVRGQPGDFVNFPEYARHADNIYRFQPRSDDVYVMTFPKSGELAVE